MSTTRIPSRQFFTIDFQNPGILFQFILAQFLRVYRLNQQLKKQLIKLQEIVERNEFPNQPMREQFLDNFVELTGDREDFLPLFPWSNQLGTLSTLYHYTCVLCRKKNDDLDAVKLADYAERSYRHALQARQLLLDLDKAEEKSRQQGLKSLLTSIHSFHRNIERVARLVLLWITLFCKNENVLLFLLLRHDEFDDVYGIPIVKQLFYKMFSGDLKQGEQFLLRRYGKRGFANLLPFISKKMAEFV